MPIRIGGKALQGGRLTGKDLAGVRYGGKQVWSPGGIFLVFDDGDAEDLTGYGFVHYGSDLYSAGVDNGAMRLAQPDSGPGAIGVYRDDVRYDDATATADDGYLTFRAATPGSPGSFSQSKYRTQLFARGSNGGVTHGVGVELANSTAAIVRRVAGTDNVMTDTYTFGGGDVGRLKFVGDLWTLTINGAFAAEWDDAGSSAASGASYRSLLARVDAGREFNGARYFSPAIDWVEYG